MTNKEVYERTFRTTVHLKRGFLSPPDLEFEHRGPATYKLDGKYNLIVETYPENSDFEVQAALIIADTFWGVSQEEVEEDEESCVEDAVEDDDPDNVSDDEYTTPKLDSLLGDGECLFDDDDED